MAGEVERDGVPVSREEGSDERPPLGVSGAAVDKDESGLAFGTPGKI
jgi:hypothetical protein